MYMWFDLYIYIVYFQYCLTMWDMYRYMYIIYFQGRPRHSQSQGLVERGNQTIEDKLAAIKEDENLQVGDTFHWEKHLPRIMYIMYIRDHQDVAVQHRFRAGTKPGVGSWHAAPDT